MADAEECIDSIGDDAFHGAGIDFELRGGLQEQAKGDVALASGPWEVVGSHAAGFAEDCVAESIERVGRDVADCGDAVDVGLDEGRVNGSASSENDEVRAVARLWLAPCGIRQLLFDSVRFNDEELPRL
ncbi:MAG: hypothetical protein RLZZ458_2564 [Planctomycetota bacterium]